ncbi:MAG: hypothetical protein QF681_07050 [Vicinamibacterales bacterium]|jgi:hypothetical protein|nr:hypothetical protein [Vicinamibacterales bacterium]
MTPRIWLSVMLAAALMLVLAFRTSVSESRQWLAGDSHIHSHWSVGYDRRQGPPRVLKGQEGIYSTPRNAVMARQFGLRWMVTTDHGGPNHSQLNFEQAYRELTLSRTLVPEVLQFYGMELNMPGMDHHTLIIPKAEDEAAVLWDIESQFDQNEDWQLPPDPHRRTPDARRRALEYMAKLDELPLLFANHPSRSALAIGVYGLDSPTEFRENNTLAPDVYRGMEGAPGHQASTLTPDGAPGRVDARGRLRARGGYQRRGAHTMGGFDQMTAIVGGLWDALLGEGRRFWVVATSDSHAHYADQARQGSDFWPGEFHKTYVFARPEFGDVLDGLRQGRVFAVAGDLISELDVMVIGGGERAEMGSTLRLTAGTPVDLTMTFRDPVGLNAGGVDPTVARVDLIMGRVQGPLSDSRIDRNPTTRVIARFGQAAWRARGDEYTITTRLPALDHSVYVRVRGTSTDDTEPPMDAPGENPWTDLWFYSNPIFIEVE